MINNSILHYTILKHIIENGFAPDIGDLSILLNAPAEAVKTALYELQDYHGVVLHPNEPTIWVIHPFSLAPTNFLVRSSRGLWWGNCAWCSLGVAALLKEEVVITTRIAAYDKQVQLHIRNGKLEETNFYIHFPIPMKHAWDNVIYTCSNMLVFENEAQVTEWCKRHNMQRGDIQPIDNIWEFSKKWYGNHLNPGWKKWTMAEAKEMFTEFNLTGNTWNLDATGERF